MRLRGQAGSTVVEITMFVPVILLFLLLVVGMGRLASTRADVDGAARDAARAASFQRDAANALQAAQDAATATLSDRGILCQGLAVSLDSAHTNFTAGGTVGIDVDCTVRLEQTVLTGLPGPSTAPSPTGPGADAAYGPAGSGSYRPGAAPVEANANGFGIDFDQFRQGVLQTARNRDGASLRGIEGRKFLARSFRG